VQQRLPLLLSVTALVVAVFGATPLGHAALRATVPQFAKTAGYAKFAGNSSQLNGRKSTLAGTAGSIPVVGKDGKLPASIGAVGPAGPAGAKGAPGAPGVPGISGYEVVTMTRTFPVSTSTGGTASCPSGKSLLGGGVTITLTNGGFSNSKIESSGPDPSKPDTWTASFVTSGLPEVARVTAICAEVER